MVEEKVNKSKSEKEVKLDKNERKLYAKFQKQGVNDGR